MCGDGCPPLGTDACPGFGCTPALDRQSGEVLTLKNAPVASNLRHLYAHLLENGCLTDLRNANPDFLTIYPRDVLNKIQAGDAAWEKLVPPPIVEIIKTKRLFGYRRSE